MKSLSFKVRKKINKKPPAIVFVENSGGLNLPSDYLLSHSLATIVPSTLKDLTAVFGMGTGVAPSVMSLEF